MPKTARNGAPKTFLLLWVLMRGGLLPNAADATRTTECAVRYVAHAALATQLATRPPLEKTALLRELGFLEGGPSVEELTDLGRLPPVARMDFFGQALNRLGTTPGIEGGTEIRIAAQISADQAARWERLTGQSGRGRAARAGAWLREQVLRQRRASSVASHYAEMRWIVHQRVEVPGVGAVGLVTLAGNASQPFLVALGRADANLSNDLMPFRGSPTEETRLLETPETTLMDLGMFSTGHHHGARRHLGAEIQVKLVDLANRGVRTRDLTFLDPGTGIPIGRRRIRTVTNAAHLNLLYMPGIGACSVEGPILQEQATEADIELPLLPGILSIEVPSGAQSTTRGSENWVLAQVTSSEVRVQKNVRGIVTSVNIPRTQLNFTPDFSNQGHFLRLGPTEVYAVHADQVFHSPVGNSRTGSWIEGEALAIALGDGRKAVWFPGTQHVRELQREVDPVLALESGTVVVDRGTDSSRNTEVKFQRVTRETPEVVFGIGRRMIMKVAAWKGHDTHFLALISKAPSPGLTYHREDIQLQLLKLHADGARVVVQEITRRPLVNIGANIDSLRFHAPSTLHVGLPNGITWIFRLGTTRAWQL